MVKVVPGKDVTVYIPADTPLEVITYLNRLKEEGNFSQGIMEILIRHIVRDRLEAEESPFDGGNAPTEELWNDSNIGLAEIPETVRPSNTATETQRAFSPEDILRQATRNAGKLLSARANQD